MDGPLAAIQLDSHIREMLRYKVLSESMLIGRALISVSLACSHESPYNLSSFQDIIHRRHCLYIVPEPVHKFWL